MFNETIYQISNGMMSGDQLLHFVGDLFSPGLNIGFLALVILSVIIHEHPSVPMIAIIGSYFGTWMWFCNFKLWSFLVAQWFKIIIYVVIYTIGGAVWTVPKFWLWVRKEKNRTRLKERFNSKIYKRGRDTVATAQERRDAARSMISENKLMIWSWMAYWPLNILFTLLRDPLTIFYNWVYDQLGHVYTSILLTVVDPPAENCKLEEKQKELKEKTNRETRMKKFV